MRSLLQYPCGFDGEMWIEGQFYSIDLNGKDIYYLKKPRFEAALRLVPWRRKMATHSSTLAWRIPRKAW